MSNELLSISGKVYFLENTVLRRNSTLYVRLQDVSLQDVAAKELAVQITTNAEKAGLNFNLTYKLADVLPGHRYALSARINHEDHLHFISTQTHPVELGVDHVKEQEVLVQLI